ncbi:transcriptional regulator [Tardibacter chloracetimidivorans]|uniref:Transcriptional regulator n=1 Tax=Tardibacter chloracetimidivorans TaxID=1921510 RepID=A0A1L3ZX91_9SPHN|nr:helix-turn-helix transcriptional regulator [Tardibacter chloracetimidivorans]API60244.1 transcriptional regulator [Tardibacter chloracetimidivorans]
MSSPKSGNALKRLGRDLRSARLRRGISVADLAVRAGTSPSTIARLEKGDPGVGIGTLSDVLVVFGLTDRLADLVEVRKDELGMALDAQRLPHRGKSSAGTRRAGSRKNQSLENESNDTDQNGVAF